MNMLEKIVSCNKCGQQFTVGDSSLGTIRDGDLEVQYLSCPACGAKFHILTTDSRMRELIKQRKDLQVQIRMAKTKKFNKRSFEKYLLKYEKTKKEQEKLFPTLKKQGEKLLLGDVERE